MGVELEFQSLPELPGPDAAEDAPGMEFYITDSALKGGKGRPIATIVDLDAALDLVLRSPDALEGLAGEALDALDAMALSPSLASLASSLASPREPSPSPSGGSELGYVFSEYQKLPSLACAPEEPVLSGPVALGVASGGVRPVEGVDSRASELARTSLDAILGEKVEEIVFNPIDDEFLRDGCECEQVPWCGVHLILDDGHQRSARRQRLEAHFQQATTEEVHSI